MAAKEYELIADSYYETTSKPNEPFTYKAYGRGDKIKLDETRAQELIDAGAVKDPSSDADAADLPDDPAKRRKATQTKAPSKKASENVPEDELPTGTGSTTSTPGADASPGQGDSTGR